MGKYDCMYVGDGCTSGRIMLYQEQACGSCLKDHERAPGDGNVKDRKAQAKRNAKNKASGKRKEIDAIHNGKKKAKKEEAYRLEAQSELGAALDAELTDEEAKQIVQTVVFQDPMVAEFITAASTENPDSGYAGFTGCPKIEDESVRFLWAHNSTPVVQPIDPANDSRASKTSGFLTEANARKLATWTPEPIYQTNNRLNIKKVEYWTQKLLEESLDLPLGVRLWRVAGAGGGQDKRSDIGKVYKLFFTKLIDSPAKLGLRVVE
ncbi:hypothetical protein JKP88DRAFT_253303 [Tribonema minus]|uniref:Uncharacterized protein n=1 Tax=Tribonema minus TaxID=303371 RepID=A0A835Z845_9STRA|nr:hypothetical protein JKP88DRAFT_253303 [Tribonema minus]